MKSKFTGLFRSLFGQGGNTMPPNAEPPRPAAMEQRPIAQPAIAPKVSAASKPNYSSSYTPPPVPAATQTGDLLEIPLAAVINALPMDLKAKMINSPPEGKTIFLQVETVIAQLAFGAVKITFGLLTWISLAISRWAGWTTR